MTKKQDSGRRDKEESEERGKGEVKMLFWNVAGAKSLGKKEWEFIREHDVIELVETWEEESGRIWKRELKEFDWRERKEREGNIRKVGRGEGS